MLPERRTEAIRTSDTVSAFHLDVRALSHVLCWGLACSRSVPYKVGCAGVHAVSSLELH